MYGLLSDDLTGKRVLSIGCGSGEDCHELQRRGASVVGIDLSAGLIEQARLKYPDCEYFVGNMEDLSHFADAKFDMVYSSLAVHYLHDWSSMMSEVSRVLCSGGKFQFSMGHPIRMGMSYEYPLDGGQLKGIGRIKNKDRGDVEVIGDYFAQGPTPALGTKNGPVVYGKTIPELLELCRVYGFTMVGALDPMPLREMEAISPNDYMVLKKIPEFCIYVLNKN